MVMTHLGNHFRVPDECHFELIEPDNKIAHDDSGDVKNIVNM